MTSFLSTTLKHSLTAITYAFRSMCVMVKVATSQSRLASSKESLLNDKSTIGVVGGGCRSLGECEVTWGVWIWRVRISRLMAESKEGHLPGRKGGAWELSGWSVRTRCDKSRFTLVGWLSSSTSRHDFPASDSQSHRNRTGGAPHRPQGPSLLPSPSPLSPRADTTIFTLQETVSIVETATGGLMSSALLSLPGTSACFKGGVNAYSLPAREAFLGWTQADMGAYA